MLRDSNFFLHQNVTATNHWISDLSELSNFWYYFALRKIYSLQTNFLWLVFSEEYSALHLFCIFIPKSQNTAQHRTKWWASIPSCTEVSWGFFHHLQRSQSLHRLSKLKEISKEVQKSWKFILSLVVRRTLWALEPEDPGSFYKDRLFDPGRGKRDGMNWQEDWNNDVQSCPSRDVPIGPKSKSRSISQSCLLSWQNLCCDIKLEEGKLLNSSTLWNQRHLL